MKFFRGRFSLNSSTELDVRRGIDSNICKDQIEFISSIRLGSFQIRLILSKSFKNSGGRKSRALPSAHVFVVCVSTKGTQVKTICDYVCDYVKCIMIQYFIKLKRIGPDTLFLSFKNIRHIQTPEECFCIERRSLFGTISSE